MDRGSPGFRASGSGFRLKFKAQGAGFCAAYERGVELRVVQSSCFIPSGYE